jgi:FkbM family methyltransferase
VVLHAGANCGFYAKQYAREVGQVLAIEPERVNFTALVLNCPEANVVKVQAALGAQAGATSFRTDHDFNRGGFYAVEGSDVPILRIDDFGTFPIDLIHLDVEGFEKFALEGAEAVLVLNSPVVCVEMIEGGVRFGVTDAALSDWLFARGYELAERLPHDGIFVRRL